MRGETSPVPIYEGEDGVIAWLLDGPDASYEVTIPDEGEAKRAILDSYTKEHSAEYQAQAWIDLARKLHDEYPIILDDPERIESITLHTSHHTHYVIGSGANDPQKYDPDASRETLDHSIPYIFTVALQDGAWHHADSYSPERAHRPDTDRAVEEGDHRRGRGVDAPLPLERHRGEGVRRQGRHQALRRRRDRRRDRRRRRASARRPPVRSRAVRAEVPHARRVGARGGRDRAVPRRGAAAARARPRRTRRRSRSRRRPARSSPSRSRPACSSHDRRGRPHHGCVIGHRRGDRPGARPARLHRLRRRATRRPHGGTRRARRAHVRDGRDG